MKRTLLFIACVITSITMLAQGYSEEYRPLVEEGKHWTYDNFMPLRPAEYDHYYFYNLKGDTLIAGKKCLKMYSENRANNNSVNYEAALYEENKKVYCFFPGKDEATLLYDFDCEVGDTLRNIYGLKQTKAVVKNIQTVDNGGKAIKTYTVHCYDVMDENYTEEYDIIWIEGVGATQDFFGMLPLPGNYNSLSACELNGEKLYQTIERDPTEKGYHKMGIEGKRWNYIHYYFDEEGEHRDPYSYIVKGDTIIRRTTYKKLYYQDEKTERFVCLIAESGRTVYKNTDLGNNSYDTPVLNVFFYFNRDDFGRVFTWKAKNNSGNTNWMVYGVDTIEVNNRQFRRYTCLQKYSEEGETLSTIEYDDKEAWRDIWVEGIGSASKGIENQIPSHEPELITPSEYTYFVSCYEDGECIFTAEDFYIPAMKSTNNQTYHPYYYYQGNKVPLTLNENKVVVSIPKDRGDMTEKILANIQTRAKIQDEAFDIYIIHRSEYEKLTTLDFWAEDAKSVIITSSYYTENDEEVFATPYLNVRLKNEEDIDLLTSYAGQYKLRIAGKSQFTPWFILSLTPNSEKNTLVCANELYESGVFAESTPDLASDIFPNQSYRPFVEDGKVWNVFRSDGDSGCHLERYQLINEGIVKDGKTYMKMYRSEDDMDVVYDTGLFREEGRKVYRFDSEMQKEFLMFDYSLKEGETYETYSYDERREVTYRVLSVDDYLEGPEVADPINNGHRRYLRKWTVCRTDNEHLQKTWIEGIGSLKGPLGNLYDVVLPNLTSDYLGYVECNDDYFTYLPFSFCDTLNRLVHGCNLPTGVENYEGDESHHKLTYELEGDRLHVYGDVVTQCGPNNYALFYESETDDPLVRKIEFAIQEVEPLADCIAPHATDFYVEGFSSAFDYIVVDNQGEEHPVINKTQQMTYRPFVEDGKVWKVGALNSGNPAQWVEYFYFDGDTIIDGRTCKQMMCQRYVGPDFSEYDSQRSSLSYMGAWYEEGKKVYFYNPNNKQFRLMYDFSVNANDSVQIDNIPYVIGPRQTGGMTGFKGVYRDVLMCKDGDRTVRSTPWLEGVGSIYGMTTNVIDGELADPMWFLMSCTVGDEVIYLNDTREDGATPVFMDARKQRFDFTHTVKIKPRARMKKEAALPLYGEYNDLQLGINLNPLDETYQVRITDETGKAVYEKAVNASNIVGLSINISTYAKGRYTVTIENSSESFTGAFDAHTTGIREVTNMKAQPDSHIYNLQGQQISSLRKGLNIVNGRKVFVK